MAQAAQDATQQGAGPVLREATMALGVHEVAGADLHGEAARRRLAARVLLIQLCNPKQAVELHDIRMALKDHQFLHLLHQRLVQREQGVLTEGFLALETLHSKAEARVLGGRPTDGGRNSRAQASRLEVVVVAEIRAHGPLLPEGDDRPLRRCRVVCYEQPRMWHRSLAAREPTARVPLGVDRRVALCRHHASLLWRRRPRIACSSEFIFTVLRSRTRPGGGARISSKVTNSSGRRPLRHLAALRLLALYWGNEAFRRRRSDGFLCFGCFAEGAGRGRASRR
mmetsp:Transcript_22301/g.63785  ORF Transcript_22301/g.63785 Transcript_22301/m.63785 type:complete len:282 (+) Transcript_22301:1269-2114(+)